jgi:hypothetical protein
MDSSWIYMFWLEENPHKYGGNACGRYGNKSWILWVLNDIIFLKN